MIETAERSNEKIEKIKGTVSLNINGKQIKAREGASILEAAREALIYIPTLCHDDDLAPYGACRLCVVDIEGFRNLVTSCTTKVNEGMVVNTNSEKVNESRKISMELIIANHQENCLSCQKNQDCDLQKIARYLGIDFERYNRLRKKTEVLPIDRSHPALELNPNKCILCARCVRACHEITCVGAIDLAFRGDDTRVAPFGNKEMVESTCESCGECISRCPTGALMARNEEQPSYSVKTICPYCGVGCSFYLGIRDNRVVSVRGDKESPVNKGGLCVKGRFGYDFINHTERLTKPLIRKDGVSKNVDPEATVADMFREATWEEAIELVAENLSKIKKTNGPDSIGFLSSAKFTNEENYVMQKFARAVVGTNNVDHCARL